MTALLPGFEDRRFTVGDIEIAASVGGSGPPLLLVHGYPETRVMWHHIAPRLAKRFTVVVPDLRGYGDSSKPAQTEGAANYAKRVMAEDLIGVMAQLGHPRFTVAGHDRGARVSYRMALDHPECVDRLALLDIVPTKTVYDKITAPIAQAYFHWFFLIQPQPFPETLIGADPDFWLDTLFGAWGGNPEAFTPEAVAEYKRCSARPRASTPAAPTTAPGQASTAPTTPPTSRRGARSPARH